MTTRGASDGESGCRDATRKVVTVYGERLTLARSGFVGNAIHAGAIVDAVCNTEPAPR